MGLHNWQFLSELVRIQSKWVTLIGEYWLSDAGEKLEYWRVEKADSVVVLPIQAGKIICVQPTFRVGIQRATIDFPGGRLLAGQHPLEAVPKILERELGIRPSAIKVISSLNQTKWVINSSFSNQGLWGFIAEIDEAFTIPETSIGGKFKLDKSEVFNLLTQLDCLQCRMVLLEWFYQTAMK